MKKRGDQKVDIGPEIFFGQYIFEKQDRADEGDPSETLASKKVKQKNFEIKIIEGRIETGDRIGELPASPGHIRIFPIRGVREGYRKQTPGSEKSQIFFGRFCPFVRNVAICNKNANERNVRKQENRKSRKSQAPPTCRRFVNRERKPRKSKKAVMRLLLAQATEQSNQYSPTQL